MQWAAKSDLLLWQEFEIAQLATYSNNVEDESEAEYLKSVAFMVYDGVHGIKYDLNESLKTKGISSVAKEYIKQVIKIADALDKLHTQCERDTIFATPVWNKAVNDEVGKFLDMRKKLKK